MNQQSAKNKDSDDGYMFVRMMEGIAGPGFRAAPKQVIKAKKDEALRLLKSGAAVPVQDADKAETMSAPVLGEYRSRVDESKSRMAQS